MKIKVENTNGNIVIGVALVLIYALISILKYLFKCKHRRTKETWIEPISSEIGLFDRYQVVTRCKKCNKLLHTKSITKEEYIRHERMLKFDRIIKK